MFGPMTFVMAWGWRTHTSPVAAVSRHRGAQCQIPHILSLKRQQAVMRNAILLFRQLLVKLSKKSDKYHSN